MVVLRLVRKSSSSNFYGVTFFLWSFGFCLWVCVCVWCDVCFFFGFVVWVCGGNQAVCVCEGVRGCGIGVQMRTVDAVESRLTAGFFSSKATT